MAELAPPFRLRTYLAADLRMAHGLMHPDAVAPSGLRLWTGMISPRFLPVLLARLAHRFYLWRLAPIAKLLSLFNFFLFGIEIAVRCPIGPGFYLPHTQGTVLGASRIGANAIIYQGVTLGAKAVNLGYEEDARPIIGDNVEIGAGAKIIGYLTIGDGAKIGANAVVVRSVPENCVAVGIPAKIVGEGPNYDGG